MKVSLPDDNWANIRDPRNLSERLNERLEDAQFSLLDVPGMREYIGSVNDPDALTDMSTSELLNTVGSAGLKAVREVKKETILVYVESWSFGLVDIDTLMDAPKAAIDALTNKIGEVVKGTGGPHLNTEPNPDVASPITPSDK